ncbi:hypothetical protein ACO0LG_07930 [Undibacterium sp. Ji42W]|uniref:hypothetical protein n=1 Tax=Undibacterium sp. Ji42W TaxID=3413039 RepID=UPI003BF2510D
MKQAFSNNINQQARKIMKQQTTSSAVTSSIIKANKADVWQKVGFYEHVKKPASWLLKLSLPVPQEVEGKYAAVGDTCRCKYSDGGYLTKRITNIIDQSRIEFEIIEQNIRYKDTIKLLGGYIEVEQIDGEQSIVRMLTYYDNRIAPRLISSYFIEKVIKTMHEFVIADMQLQLENTAHGSRSAYAKG